MKVLFAGLHFAYFKNFESAVRELADRGHSVHLSADEVEAPVDIGGQDLVERLAAQYPSVSWCAAGRGARVRHRDARRARVRRHVSASARS